jgi:hypothetical protein
LTSYKSQKKKKIVKRVSWRRIGDVDVGAAILARNIAAEGTLSSLLICATPRNREERQVSQYL